MNINILLVEDNLKLAKYLKKMLTDEGYHVATESRGDSAAYRILREQPDLVILDIMLPGMNGEQICETVRDAYRGKILMLTALNTEQNEVTSLKLGADDYVTKPVKEEVLKARIVALLRRPNLIVEAKKIQFDHLIIDLIKKSVRYCGNPIDLSPSEYELLALLAKNADTVLSRDNIDYALRGREYDGVDRSIDLKISRLRKILGDDLDNPYRIKTIYGKGYLFLSDAWKDK
ncbi:response regulator [Legionella anisa]|uniref:DNA-binding response regulator n=1 Tax=Legionella anisa TaxID=28082 RepID=A0AAX0WX19_9GAMM|nr:response regulator [Legionella anisa]AWN73498.1 DNA-binding response regulator [Legionella anisa]KTC70803.1 transcriptional regulatory protein CpxR [Legionella anisa]MBN5935358.1 response regulator [Legionella anisa]MCW8426373.1 response regulator [Legionella anisa]MCW8448033.1 response regulator [Legionella anisa]